MTFRKQGMGGILTLLPMLYNVKLRSNWGISARHVD